MVLTKSDTRSIGQIIPFSLPDTVSKQTVSLEDCKGSPATLVIFMCNHCPFVVHLLDAIVKDAKEYQSKGAKVIAISSNSAATHPQDGPDRMADLAARLGFTFPYLYDETQEVAKSYGAACTPEFLVLDKDLVVRYHGRYDSSTPGNNQPITGKDLRAAMEEMLSTGEFTGANKSSMGCNIKWHPGNEPNY